MPVPTNIKTILAGRVVESARVEYKESWNPLAALKTICAFANDLDNWGGGYIVLGVKEENGRPGYPLKGIDPDKIDEYQKDILAKCKLLRPIYMPIIDVVEHQDKQLIVLWCPGGDNRPYSAPKSLAKDNKERIYYIRKGSATIIPSPDEERELFQLANKIPYDDRINHSSEMTDLNITLIQSYLKEIKSSLFNRLNTSDFSDICQDMNIVNSLPEYTKPKNIGLLLFCLQPERFFPYAQIDVVQFPQGLGGDNIIEQTFKGPVHQQLRDALRYIQNSLITTKVVKHPHRAKADRFFNYPFAAIEEALANAVYHRGYDEREPIEMRVEPDRIEIVSFPGPDRSVTAAGLKNYRVSNRRYRNRRLGDFLKELGLTEGRNTGFSKILQALEDNGSPKPEFETDENHSYFLARIFVQEYFLLDDEELLAQGLIVLADDDFMEDDETEDGEQFEQEVSLDGDEEEIGIEGEFSPPKTPSKSPSKTVLEQVEYRVIETGNLIENINVSPLITANHAQSPSKLHLKSPPNMLLEQVDCRENEGENLLKNDNAVLIENHPQNDQKSPSKSPPKPPSKTASKQVASLQNKIIKTVIKQPNISRKELQITLKISEYKLRKELARLKQDNRLEYVGSSRNGCWVVHEEAKK